MINYKFSFLLLYALILVGITIYSFKSRKATIYSLMWFAYAVSAVFCVLCKCFQKELVGISPMHNMWYDLSDTTLWGYLLIVFCCFISFRPFYLFNQNNQLDDLGRSKFGRNFCVFYSYMYLIGILIFVILSFSSIKKILSIEDFGALRSALYNNSENESAFVMTSNFIADFCYKMCLQFKYVSVFIAFILIKENIHFKLSLILLISTFSLYYLYAMGNAARGGLLIFVFCIFLLGLTFFRFFPKKSKRIILLLACVIFFVVLILFMVITISRFGDTKVSNPIIKNICFYLGHGPIEFSKLTGSLEHFSYGKAIGGRLLNHYFGIPYSWETVQKETGYPQIGPVFTTYLGYLYTDFGSIGCIAFCFVWSQLLCLLLKKSHNKLSTIFLFTYYLSYFVTGIFVIGRLEYAAIITKHILFLCILVVEIGLKHIKNIENLI